MRRRFVRLAAILAVASSIGAADDSPVGLADFEGYRAALAAKPDGAAAKVTFRDLWDHPETFAGRTVAVEGRLARIFRQPKIGEFPPLAEAWITSPVGDPFCLVFPISPGNSTPEIGASVAFSGTYIRRIVYQGGDDKRLAPLIVGPGPPSADVASAEIRTTDWSSTDWTMAAVGTLVVGWFLARRHLSRPPTIRRPDEPPPLFVDAEPTSEEDSHDHESGG